MSNYIKINTCDTINTMYGLAMSFWFSGCPHKCDGCFNKDTWDKTTGSEITEEVIESVLYSLGREPYSFFSVLGGEPFAPYNLQTTLNILSRVKKMYPHIKTMVWTGYELHEFARYNDLTKFDSVDYIMDGRYDSTKPTKKKLRGSDNQRLFKRFGEVFALTNEGDN